jgi:hypothetical protein
MPITMKARLAMVGLLCALTFGAPVRAQTLLTLGAGSVSGGFTPSCSQSAALIARASSPTVFQQIAWNALICGGVTDGWWAKTDVVQLFAADNSTDALLNLVSSSFTASLVSVSGAALPTFTANAGFNPIVSGAQFSYVDSGYNPSTAGGNYAQNAAGVGVCVLEQGGVGINYGGQVVDNLISESTGTDFYPNYPGGSVYARVNDSPQSGAVASGATTSAGFMSATRSASNAVQVYKQGSSIGTTTETSGALVNSDFGFGINPDSGSPVGGYDGLYMGWIAGGAYTSTDWANIYSRLSTYMTAVHGSSC